jgi:hypothetical protein
MPPRQTPFTFPRTRQSTRSASLPGRRDHIFDRVRIAGGGAVPYAAAECRDVDANVISTGVRPWPAPELIQKIYQRREARAFSGDEHRLATATLGFYSDLESSIHSEDAITWGVFGP